MKILRNRVLCIVAVLGALGGLAGGATAETLATALEVSTQPALFPAFDASVHDYVVRCEPSNGVQVSLSTPRNVKVSVDSGPLHTGSFTQTVSLGTGQSFTISVIESGVTRRYFIRCLPSDFPTFTATRDGPTQAQWYIVAPSLSFAPPPPGESPQYVAFFDNNGVPVWWMPSATGTIPLDAKLLPNGNVVWLHFNPGPIPGAEEHTLKGKPVLTLDTVPGGADHHDILLLANGNYVMGRYFVQSGVDMSSCGGSSSGDLVDFELQELRPNGGPPVWTWRASDYIPFSEVPDIWRTHCATNGDGDIYHWNSVKRDGDGYVLSFRHLNAVYRIDRRTGAIDWKLGGVPRQGKSLNVIRDPLSPDTFCGQHDARINGSSLTVFDDGTLCGCPGAPMPCNRPSRAVRFVIDETAHTARLVEDLMDPDSSSAVCCGSTRRLPGTNWVTQWGNNPYFTEQTRAGAPVFKLSFTPLFTYRAIPLLPGRVSRAALRAGMNAQYPRP